MGAEQHFVTAYAHYSNGTIEIVNRNIINLLRCMISELRCDKSDWPWFVKLVEHAINHRPQRRLAGHAPVTVMTGLPADNPIDVIFCNPKSLAISRPLHIRQSINRCLKCRIALSVDAVFKVFGFCVDGFGPFGSYISEYIIYSHIPQSVALTQAVW